MGVFPRVSVLATAINSDCVPPHSIHTQLDHEQVPSSTINPSLARLRKEVPVTLSPPSGAPNFDGSSLNVAELAGIDNPIEGTWIAIVDGFSISSRKGDMFGLRLVAVDKVIKVK